jgi:lysophospholipase L1-like esterase
MLVIGRILFTTITCTITCTLVCPVYAALSPDDRIWLIGDSLGVLIKPYLADKAKTEGLPFGGSPVAGSTIIQWDIELWREKWRMRAFKPTLVIVVLGANDACLAPHVIANEPPFLKSLNRQLNRTKARVVWMGPPKIGSTEPLLCWSMKDCLARAVPGLDAFKAMVVAEGATYLDGRNAGAEMGTDLLHPTVMGRVTWVNWAWDELKR